MINFCDLKFDKTRIEDTLGYMHNTRLNEAKNINERFLDIYQKKEIIKLLEFYPNLKEKLF